MRFKVLKKRRKLLSLDVHLNFIRGRPFSSKRVLHLITLHNVNTLCITETSGTYLVGIFLPYNLYFLGIIYLTQTCGFYNSKLLNQKWFHCSIFLTAILFEFSCYV